MSAVWSFFDTVLLAISLFHIPSSNSIASDFFIVSFVINVTLYFFSIVILVATSSFNFSNAKIVVGTNSNAITIIDKLLIFLFLINSDITINDTNIKNRYIYNY